VRVRDVMSSAVITVPPEMRVKQAAELLERRMRSIPVLRSRRVVGMVAREVPGVVAVRLEEA
jgi:CBS domain-containing protein